MELSESIFEERWIRIDQKYVTDNSNLRDFIEVSRNDLWPKIEDNGGEVIFLMSGLVGTPPNVFLQFTQYPNIELWRKTQNEFLKNQKLKFLNEDVKLFKAITSRPLKPFLLEYRRPMFTNRRFFFENKDVEKAAELSEKYVWPLYDEWGCTILGLFTPIVNNPLQEVFLCSGYHSVDHWDETRIKPNMVKPEKIKDQKLWDEGVKGVYERANLTLKTTLSFMRCIYLPCDKGY